MEDFSILDAEELLLRLSKGENLGELEMRELSELLEAVDTSAVGRSLSIDDIYAYVTVIKKSRLEQFRHILEKFLECEDALTVALVLETLCMEWNLTEEYLERVFSFALGESWDEDQDVQQTALKVLGEYLHSAECLKRDKLSPREEHVLSLLVSLFDDEGLATWTKHTVYFALCRAAGKSWEELPPECSQLDFSADSRAIDHSMIQQLRTLLPS